MLDEMCSSEGALLHRTGMSTLCGLDVGYFLVISGAVFCGASERWCSVFLGGLMTGNLKG